MTRPREDRALPRLAATCLELLAAVLRGQHVEPAEVAQFFRGSPGKVARIASLSALQAVRTLQYRGLAIPLSAAHAEQLQHQRSDLPLLPFVATPAGVQFIDGIAANAKK